MNRKHIYLLLGPKGSGKSFIGKLIEKEFGIKFIRVEDRAKEIKKERQIDDEIYVKEVFEAIEKEVRKNLEHYERIVFESTGLTVYFDRMLESLKSDHEVITIFVHANEELCLERVKSRDSSIHINVSDDQVRNLNQKVFEKKKVYDLKIINEGKNVEEIIEELKNIIKN